MMAPQNPPTVPAWVRKRDGRLVPFESDKICRSLFAASDNCGRPDAFLARELADVAVHFLADELSGSTPTTEQVREVVVKVLREVRQYALASAYEDRTRDQQVKSSSIVSVEPTGAPGESREAFLRTYALQAVFTRDLVAAHQDGLIVLEGLETPEKLHTVTAGPLRKPDDLLARLEEGSAQAGQTLVLDGPEHALAQAFVGQKRVSRQQIEERARGFTDVLLRGLRMTGLHAVVNLNASPPPWAAESAGPLFAEQQPESDTSRLTQFADALAEAIGENGYESVRISWHLAEADFSAEDRLLGLARAALSGPPLSFVFDRPRRPVLLGEGVSREHGAVLLAVGLDLPRLVGLASQGTNDPQKRVEQFRGKLRSLARLALSAALQKREYLRARAAERPELASGFLLERARLLAVPLGLEEAMTALTGQRMCAVEETLALAGEVLRSLSDTLRAEGRAATLETCLDALPGRASAGPSCWDTDAAIKAQLRALGLLHTAAGCGTGTAFIPNDPAPAPEHVASWLRWASTQTSITRLVLRRQHPPLRQMTFE